MEFQDVHQQFDGNQRAVPMFLYRTEHKNAICYKRKKYLVAVVTLFGCASLCVMRANFIVVWINLDNFGADFPASRGVIRSSDWFYVLGFVIAPLGAVGVRKFGGAVTFGAGVGFIALLTCFTPALLYWHYSALWIARTLAGVFEGVCTCGPIDVLRLWSIPTERGSLIELATAGFVIGNAVGFPICRALASENWRISFYVTGVFSLLWCMIWFIVVKNTPEEDKLITTEEESTYNKEMLIMKLKNDN